MKEIKILKLFFIVFFFGLISTVSAQQDFFRVVDEMPQYPGGEQAMSRFIQQNITYPAAALQNNEEGTVYVTFIVEKDGSLSQVQAARGSKEVFVVEAQNVIKRMPRWTPGKNGGETVRVMLSLPIEFNLRN